MLSERFERFIDIFRPPPSDAPPETIGRFYAYYLRQVWPCFAGLLVVGLIGALIEVALFSYLSKIIDLVNASHPGSVFRDHWLLLSWMGAVALIIRPVFIALHDLLIHRLLTRE